MQQGITLNGDALLVYGLSIIKCCVLAAISPKRNHHAGKSAPKTSRYCSCNSCRVKA